jgi:type II secretory pathway pseudopilin PulG
MMNFKSNVGFSLIEATLAIAIIGMVLSPIFLLESNVFNAVAKIAERFHRNLFSQQFLFTASREQKPSVKEFKLEGNQDLPPSIMRYTFGPITAKSSLSKLKNMYRKQVITSGKDPRSPEGLAVQFVYKPDRPQQ